MSHPGTAAPLGALRSAARLAAAVGALGSLALMLAVRGRAPGLLVATFAIWVLAPFLALAWAGEVSERWPAATQTALQVATLVVALGSLAAYAHRVFWPPASTPAFVFVAVPPVSLLLAATLVVLAAFLSRRRP